MQALEKIGVLEQDEEKGGRRITQSGQRDLDRELHIFLCLQLSVGEICYHLFQECFGTRKGKKEKLARINCFCSALKHSQKNHELTFPFSTSQESPRPPSKKATKKRRRRSKHGTNGMGLKQCFFTLETDITAQEKGCVPQS